MIYLDNASTTYVYEDFIDIIKEDLKNYWGNASNLYSFGQNSRKIIEDAREMIAQSLGVDTEEIFFTSGASEGNSWIAKQADILLISPYEHHNLLNNPQAIIVGDDYLETYKNFASQFPELANFKEKKWIYAHMMVNNESGEIFSVKNMANLAHKMGILFASDFTQALGNVNLNLKKLNVDYGVFSGHKIHTPKGIGFNYFNKDTINLKEIKPLIYGGGQESHIRAGTENIPYIHVLGLAVKRAVDLQEIKNKKSLELKKEAINCLANSTLKNNFIIVSPVNSINSTLCICLKDIESELISALLSDEKIFIGTGSACNTGTFSPSEVLLAMGIPQNFIKGEIRLSFDLKNTIEEIKIVINRIEYYYKELTQK